MSELRPGRRVRCPSTWLSARSHVAEAKALAFLVVDEAKSGEYGPASAARARAERQWVWAVEALAAWSAGLTPGEVPDE